MSWRLIVATLVVMAVACGVSWRSGWSAHADHINALADQKRKKAEKAIQPTEEKAAQSKEEGKIVYRTITRDVVKYVQSPDRTLCKFDDDSIQLRQRAIDAANSIPGFDAAPMQGK